MNDLIKQKIIKTIQGAQSEEELAGYFYKIAEKLKKPRYEEERTTLRTAMYAALQMKEPVLAIRLKDPKFKKLSDLFWLTNGLHILAAPSNHGKTFWAMRWAEEAAMQDHDVFILSLEMTSIDLGMRQLSSEFEIPVKQIILNQIEDRQREVMTAEIQSERYNYLDRIHLDKFNSMDWVKIKGRLLDRMISLRPKLIIIDYAQMIFDSSERDDRLSRVLGDIARELKLFADKTAAAVLLLSQMNREALKEAKQTKNWERFGEVPLSHEFVKESGGIVEAADSVQLVCIPQRFHGCPAQFANKFQVTIDKSRQIGERGSVLLPMDINTMRLF